MTARAAKSPFLFPANTAPTKAGAKTTPVKMTAHKLHFYFSIQFSLLVDFEEISKEMNYICSTGPRNIFKNSKFQKYSFLSWLAS